MCGKIPYTTYQAVYAKIKTLKVDSDAQYLPEAMHHVNIRYRP